MEPNPAGTPAAPPAGREASRSCRRSSASPRGSGSPRTLAAAAARIEIESLRRRSSPAPSTASTRPCWPPPLRPGSRRSNAASLRPVINATGVIVHTNLGRAPLAPEAAAAAGAVAGLLDARVRRRQRRARQPHVHVARCSPRSDRRRGRDGGQQQRRRRAAGDRRARRAARRRSSSRGQLVEIGGSFRIPDIMRESGATMVEVGTTNKTHASTTTRRRSRPQTGPSCRSTNRNFRVVGFTEDVAARRARGARRASTGCRVFEDRAPASSSSRSARRAARRRRRSPPAPICLLLGRQAARRAAGRHPRRRADAIARLKKHPLARALRLDKMTLAALEATLRLRRDRGPEAIPARDADGRRRRGGAAARGGADGRDDRRRRRRSNVGPRVAGRRRRAARRWSSPAPSARSTPGPDGADRLAGGASHRRARRSSRASPTDGCSSIRERLGDGRGGDRRGGGEAGRLAERRRGAVGADARHRRAHRPRQVRARQGAHRHRPRPPRRRRRSAASPSSSASPSSTLPSGRAMGVVDVPGHERFVRQMVAGADRHRRRPARGRRRRRRHAADARAPRDHRPARHRARRRRRSPSPTSSTPGPRRSPATRSAGCSPRRR